jgi:opacity protein-like surface antigen
MGPADGLRDRRRRVHEREDRHQSHRGTLGGVNFPATVVSDGATLFGLTVGGGFEYAFANHRSFGLEARYTWYGTHTFNAGTLATQGFPPNGLFSTALATQTLQLNTVEVMAKLNWKFDWGGPVIAR